LQQASAGAINYYSLIGQPEAAEKPGVDFNGTGYITADILKQALALDDYDFYLCGPPPFMQALYDAIRDLGVRDARIFAEAFGPAALTRRPDEGTSVAPVAEEAEEAVIQFSQSGFEQRWNAGDDTLLEVAESHGLTPDYGCRSGSCGSCLTKITAGTVAYRSDVTAPVDDGEVLICCAVPAKGSDTIELEL